MRRTLTLTDLTQMRDDRVCIAGVDEAGRNCRPVVRWGNWHTESLYRGGGPPLQPFAVVQIELYEERPDPPHTEDRVADPWSVRFVRQLDETESAQCLEHLLDGSVASIFGAEIHLPGGPHVRRGDGTRSLGTIRPTEIVGVPYATRETGGFRCGIDFRDGTGDEYELPVTDLTWRLFCAAKRPIAHDDADMASRLRRLLARRSCYLRLGLSRGWVKHPDRCYLQITGVYPFPSYTRGKTHADFAQTAGAMAVREEHAEYA